MNTPSITTELVRNLITQQFPQWKDLRIQPVAVSGWDNRTFHLGDRMTVRLPSANIYADKIKKEYLWLPLLAPHIPTVTIPRPLALGKPSPEYPWPWAIYQWIEGESLNTIDHQAIDMIKLAQDIGFFLRDLQKITTVQAENIAPGPHNFYRGAHPKIYESETLTAIKNLESYVDHKKAIAVWNTGMESTWSKAPVWIHGDMASGNILIKEGKLVAIIDFGGMGIGDPACDLVLAWTLFTGKSRNKFIETINLDHDTWERARAWALWKALITLQQLPDKTNSKGQEQLRIIYEIFEKE